MVQNPSTTTYLKDLSTVFTAVACAPTQPTVVWQSQAPPVGGTAQAWVGLGAGQIGVVNGGYMATSPTVTTKDHYGYLYRAVFTASGGSVTTSAAMLNVSIPPTVTIRLSDQTKTAYSTTTFTTEATGGPPTSPRWSFLQNGVLTWLPSPAFPTATITFSPLVPGVPTRTTLTITAIPPSLNGAYVQVQWVNGTDQTAWTYAKLTVASGRGR